MVTAHPSGFDILQVRSFRVFGSKSSPLEGKNRGKDTKHHAKLNKWIQYFVKDYEAPKSIFLDMDTTTKSAKESLDEILNVYW